MQHSYVPAGSIMHTTFWHNPRKNYSRHRPLCAATVSLQDCLQVCRFFRQLALSMVKMTSATGRIRLRD